MVLFNNRSDKAISKTGKGNTHPLLHVPPSLPSAKADRSLPRKSFSGVKTLVIVDSVTYKVKLQTPDIEANLRVLACGQTTHGVRLDAPNNKTRH